MNYDNLHLDIGETVILEVRKHWIIFVGIALGFFMAGLFPLIVFTVLSIFIPNALDFTLTDNDGALFLFFYTLWLLTLWILFFIDWTKYYLDVWFVTEKRIISIEQKFIFHREISNLRFDKIQDITVSVEGFISTMLDFGNIRVQTASEDNREFFIKTVRHPDNVRNVIFRRQNKINEGSGSAHHNSF